MLSSELPTSNVVGSESPGRSRRFWLAVRTVGVPWLCGRGIVVAALGVVHAFPSHFTGLGVRHQVVGLFGWDAAFYRSIAQHGYRAVESTDGLRFFPLYPLLARLFGGSDVALLLIANLAMLAALAMLQALVLAWCDPLSAQRTATRAVWIMALGPGVTATVMGYAEPLFLVFAIGCCLALQRDSTLFAAALACLAALTRPVGLLLVVLFVVEAWRRRSAVTALGAVGPLFGTGAYLAWVGGRTGDWLRPLRLQGHSNLRGANVDPVRAVWSALRAIGIEHRVGPGLHLLWAVLAVGLCVVAWRRVPAGGAAFAAALVLLSLTTRNLDSYERYLLAAFPLAIAAASLRPPKWLDRAAIAGLAVALAGYATLAFATTYIP